MQSSVLCRSKKPKGRLYSGVSLLPCVDMKAVLSLFLVVGAFFVSVTGAYAQTTTSSSEVVRLIAYPTEKTIPLSDDFGQSRGTRPHEGNDLIGAKMTPLYAAVTGRVKTVVIPEATWGYAITLEDADGYTYHYIHMNNDTPGTDDGMGGPQYAYAPGIVRGAQVTKGQLIGWMGDSGNAESVTSHLHFEIRRSDGTAIDPYQSLVAALNEGKYAIATVKAASPDITTDKGLVSTGGVAPCVSGSLVKSPVFSAVYYCGADGKRYAFPNERVYFSWYANFDSVQTLTEQGLANIPLGGNVTYRPGTKMVKITSLPNVYVIEKGGVLRWVRTPAEAAALYGTNWKKEVHDISDAFFTNYTVGESL